MKSQKNCYGPECEELNCFQCLHQTSNHDQNCECATCEIDKTTDATGAVFFDCDNGL